MTWQITGAVSTAKTTDASGNVVFSTLPIGDVTFSSGSNIDWKTPRILGWTPVNPAVGSVNLLGFNTLVTVGDSGNIDIALPDPPERNQTRVDVVFPDGTPVPGATMNVTEQFFPPQNNCGVGSIPWFELASFTALCRTAGVSAAYATGLELRNSHPVDGNGGLTISHFLTGFYASATFSDPEFTQTSGTSLLGGPNAQIVLPYMPRVVDPTTSSTPTEPGAFATITAKVVGSSGTPLKGRSVTITAKDASAECASPSPAISDSSGIVRLKVCVSKTSSWQVKGAGLVPSRAIEVKRLSSLIKSMSIRSPAHTRLTPTWNAGIKMYGTSVAGSVSKLQFLITKPTLPAGVLITGATCTLKARHQTTLCKVVASANARRITYTVRVKRN